MTNVTSLLKTVKAVEDEHTRGTRALEATIEAIAQEIRVGLHRIIHSVSVLRDNNHLHLGFHKLSWRQFYFTIVNLCFSIGF